MKITVIGTGYVGLVSGTCLADVGNEVLCLDVDPAKIKILEDGGLPICEPGLLDMVRRNVARFGNELSGKHFTRWGLAVKANTDDMRVPTNCQVSKDLLSAGASVTAYDPVATTDARHCFPNDTALSYADSLGSALDNADAPVIVTEWKEFSSPDFDTIKAKRKLPVIFDGRNLYDPKVVRGMGFEYLAIGR